jgi:hypothetical protein
MARSRALRTALAIGTAGILAMSAASNALALTSSTGVAVTPAATSGPSAKNARGEISALIVRLRPGRSIEVNGQLRGLNRVTGPIRNSLSVGPYLGLRMYRIDFARPVSERVATRVAAQLARDPGIAFAEPDSTISTQVSETD